MKKVLDACSASGVSRYPVKANIALGLCDGGSQSGATTCDVFGRIAQLVRARP